MSSAAGQARCLRVPTCPGLGCEWAGCRARRETCWVPEGDMRPELQVAVRCDLSRAEPGVCRPGGPSRSRPPQLPRPP